MYLNKWHSWIAKAVFGLLAYLCLNSHFPHDTVGSVLPPQTWICFVVPDIKANINLKTFYNCHRNDTELIK